MRINDFLLAGLLAALALYTLIQAMSFPHLAGMQVGPGLFPAVLASALLLAVAALVLGNWREAVRSPWMTFSFPARDPRGWLRAAAVVTASGLFAVAGASLGFMVVAVLSLGGLLLAFGVKWRTAVPLTIILVVAIDILFVRVLRIPLPLGIAQPFGGWL